MPVKGGLETHNPGVRQKAISQPLHTPIPVHNHAKTQPICLPPANEPCEKLGGGLFVPG